LLWEFARRRRKGKEDTLFRQLTHHTNVLDRTVQGTRGPVPHLKRHTKMQEKFPVGKEQMLEKNIKKIKNQ
jgi:hypothetical protein